MLNKGKAADVNSGIFEKKMKGPLLIEVTFNARTMPIVGNVPPLVPIPLARLLIKPPNFIKFQKITLVDVSLLIYLHLYQACECITTLVIYVNDVDEETPYYSIVDLEEKS